MEGQKRAFYANRSTPERSIAAWQRRGSPMHSLSSLAIIVLAPLTLVVNAGAFVLCLLWLCA